MFFKFNSEYIALLFSRMPPVEMKILIFVIKMPIEINIHTVPSNNLKMLYFMANDFYYISKSLNYVLFIIKPTRIKINSHELTVSIENFAWKSECGKNAENQHLVKVCLAQNLNYLKLERMMEFKRYLLKIYGMNKNPPLLKISISSIKILIQTN